MLGLVDKIKMRIMPVPVVAPVQNNVVKKQEVVVMKVKHNTSSTQFKDMLEMEMLKLQDKHLHQSDVDALFRRYAK